VDFTAARDNGGDNGDNPTLSFFYRTDDLRFLNETVYKYDLVITFLFREGRSWRLEAEA